MKFRKPIDETTKEVTMLGVVAKLGEKHILFIIDEENKEISQPFFINDSEKYYSNLKDNELVFADVVFNVKDLQDNNNITSYKIIDKEIFSITHEDDSKNPKSVLDIISSGEFQSVCFSIIKEFNY